MAEIENRTPRSNNKKILFIKRNTRIDLTPMVDLGFLLITFFVFTTTMSQPAVMNLNMPYEKAPPCDDICEYCVLTIMLAKDNVIKYYEGMGGTNQVIKETSFGSEGIRDIIVQKRIAVKNVRRSSDNFVMIIRPSDESTFQNFVDIIDEVAINNIKRYYISEIDKSDLKLPLHLK